MRRSAAVDPRRRRLWERDLPYAARSTRSSLHSFVQDPVAVLFSVLRLLLHANERWMDGSERVFFAPSILLCYSNIYSMLRSLLGLPLENGSSWSLSLSSAFHPLSNKEGMPPSSYIPDQVKRRFLHPYRYSLLRQTRQGERKALPASFSSCNASISGSCVVKETVVLCTLHDAPVIKRK